MDGGTPQGAVISRLLANLYLHRRSREEAEAALSDIRGWVEEMDSDCTRDQNAPRRRSASRRRFSRLPIRGGRRWVRRLRALLRKHEKRPGFGRCHADHQRWPNAFFAQAGLFALHTARLAAKHSR